MDTDTPMPTDDELMKLEDLRKRINDELSPSQRLLFLSLVDKEMKKLDAKLDDLLSASAEQS